MNDLQKTEFEILRAFVSVCEKLGLKYYLVCGSALGAVKYQGFIPWDDDIDVALVRKDYETFLKEAPALLPDFYFIQNHKTDPEFPLIGSKIRDSRTSFFERGQHVLDMNHGVFIDVFPLDGYPDDETECNKLEKKKVYYARRSGMDNDCPRGGIRSLTVYLLHKIFGVYNNSKALAECNAMLASYPAETSKIWCNHGNSCSKVEYAPREQYGEGAKMLFEGLEVYVPQKYDEYLTQKYGDWRSDLPEEQQKGHHHQVILDLERPYTDYMNDPRVKKREYF